MTGQLITGWQWCTPLPWRSSISLYSEVNLDEVSVGRFWGWRWAAPVAEGHREAYVTIQPFPGADDDWQLVMSGTALNGDWFRLVMWGSSPTAAVANVHRMLRIDRFGDLGLLGLRFLKPAGAPDPYPVTHVRNGSLMVEPGELAWHSTLSLRTKR